MAQEQLRGHLTQLYDAMRAHNQIGLTRHAELKAASPETLKNPSADTNPAKWFITQETIKGMIQTGFNLPTSITLFPGENQSLLNVANLIRTDKESIDGRTFFQIAYETLGNSGFPEDIDPNLMVDVYGKEGAINADWF